MQVRKAVAGSVIGVGMGAALFAGMGTASAETGASGAPGAAGAAGGSSASQTGTVNGNRVSILSNNTVVLKVAVFNGNSFLNGNLSGNIFNSGANSFNTDNSVSKFYNSFNTVTITKTDTKNTTITTNNSGAPGKGGWEH